VGNCLANGTTSAIAGNHGHVITVTKADIMAGVDKDYHIMGAATHDHVLTITAAQFAMLALNTNISDTSTTTSLHDHVITISCA
jgi:hypothetical protein